MKKRCPNANISRVEMLKVFFKPLRAFFAKGFFFKPLRAFFAKGFLFKPLRAFFAKGFFSAKGFFTLKASSQNNIVA